jgi:hypothetical protein
MGCPAICRTLKRKQNSKTRTEKQQNAEQQTAQTDSKNDERS